MRTFIALILGATIAAAAAIILDTATTGRIFR